MSSTTTQTPIAHASRGRAAHRRDDLRLLRGPRREEAQPHGRRERHGELRDGEGEGHLPRGDRGRRPDRDGGEDRVHRRGTRAAPGRGASGRRTRRGGPRARRPAAAADRLRRPRRPGDPAVHGPGPPVRQLAVARAHPRRTRRRLGRAALPPGRLDERPARRGHHGHPGLARHPGRVRLVAVGAVLRRRGHARHAARLRVHRRRAWTAPRRSTSKSPPESPPSSCSAATWRPAPSAGPEPRCGR